MSPGELTPELQHRLQQTLAQWRHWRCEPPLSRPPVVVAGAPQGYSNATVRVRGPRDYMVRLDRVMPADLGLNRQGEWSVLQRASAAGIAPVPRYFNPDIGCLVTDYIEADGSAHSATAIAQLLRAIHAMPATHYRLELRERFAHYENLLLHREPDGLAPVAGQRDKIYALLDSLAQQPAPRALCHNDLLHANRIASGGRLWALDWEYCAMGNPWFDVAVVVVGDGLSRLQRHELLEAWLQRPALPEDEEALQQQVCLYRYLEWLWYCAVQPPGTGKSAQATRLDALLAALAGPD